MDMPKICEVFQNEDARRATLLNTKRKCAALTKPWLLPPMDQASDAKLPENYQSVGSRGVTTVEGAMLLDLYPLDQPWFSQEPSPAVLYGTNPVGVEQMRDALFLQDLTVHALLESSGPSGRSRRGGARGFRTAKRSALARCVVLGDALEQITDDYGIKVFRMDHYVTLRDSRGDVLFHIVRERIDPFSLTPEQFDKSGLRRDDLAQKSAGDRTQDLYTRCEWNPATRTWVIQQEINERIIVESEETVSPFISTPFELVEGESYGRGLIEQNIGDLRSLDELEMRRLDLLALAAKALWCLDHSTHTRAEDLAKPSGSVIKARVQGGMVQDAALLSSAQVREFSMLTEGIRDKTAQLGKAFLIESEITPSKERTTAYQVDRVRREVDGARGSAYATIADFQQTPTILRVLHQMRRDGIIRPVPDKSVTVSLLTGIGALARAERSRKLMEFATVTAQLGPEALARLNVDVLLDVYRRYQGIYEPELVKSPEQVRRERAEAEKSAARLAAQDQAIQVAGNVAQNLLTPAPGNR